MIAGDTYHSSLRYIAWPISALIAAESRVRQLSKIGQIICVQPAVVDATRVRTGCCKQVVPGVCKSDDLDVNGAWFDAPHWRLRFNGSTIASVCVLESDRDLGCCSIRTWQVLYTR